MMQLKSRVLVDAMREEDIPQIQIIERGDLSHALASERLLSRAPSQPLGLLPRLTTG